MINSKKELKFYIMSDRMMNRGYFQLPLFTRLLRLFYPDHVINYLRHMRSYSYYAHHRSGLCGKLRYLYHKSAYYRLGLKLGYSIGPECFGYGLTLLHYGTIVVGARNRIGNYAIVFPASCIVDDGSEIGNSLMLGHGAVISKKLLLGDNVNIAANSVLNTVRPAACEISAEVASRPVGSAALADSASLTNRSVDFASHTSSVDSPNAHAVSTGAPTGNLSLIDSAIGNTPLAAVAAASNAPSAAAASSPIACVTFAGSPAIPVKENPSPWYAGIWGHDPRWLDKVNKIEALKQQMGL